MRALLCASLLSVTATYAVPAVVTGIVTMTDGNPAAHVRVVIMDSEYPFRPHCTTTTNGEGHFVCLGLPPAETYRVSITFASGASTSGPITNILDGDVRRLATIVYESPMCGTNLWTESTARLPQQVFEWPMRDRSNFVYICE